MIGCRKGQLRAMNLESPALEVQQAPRPAQIMQEMTINVQKIRVLADTRDNMLIPYFGQQRSAGLSQGNPPYGFLRPAARLPLTAALHGLCSANWPHQSMTDGHPARAYAAERRAVLGLVPKRDFIPSAGVSVYPTALLADLDWPNTPAAVSPAMRWSSYPRIPRRTASVC